jgi:hypothetical protein
MSLYVLTSGQFGDKNYNRLIFWYNKYKMDMWSLPIVHGIILFL